MTLFKLLAPGRELEIYRDTDNAIVVALNGLPISPSAAEARAMAYVLHGLADEAEASASRDARQRELSEGVDNGHGFYIASCNG